MLSPLVGVSSPGRDEARVVATDKASRQQQAAAAAKLRRNENKAKRLAKRQQKQPTSGNSDGPVEQQAVEAAPVPQPADHEQPRTDTVVEARDAAAATAEMAGSGRSVGQHATIKSKLEGIYAASLAPERRQQPSEVWEAGGEASAASTALGAPASTSSRAKQGGTKQVPTRRRGRGRARAGASAAATTAVVETAAAVKVVATATATATTTTTTVGGISVADQVYLAAAAKPSPPAAAAPSKSPSAVVQTPPATRKKKGGSGGGCCGARPTR